MHIVIRKATHATGLESILPQSGDEVALKAQVQQEFWLMPRTLDEAFARARWSDHPVSRFEEAPLVSGDERLEARVGLRPSEARGGAVSPSSELGCGNTVKHQGYLHGVGAPGTTQPSHHSAAGPDGIHQSFPRHTDTI